jgi:glycosyltransferase involved in cell wall biosynthesis
MKKIAFVVQRYGLEINGGAEMHCRQLAQKLSAIYNVEVLTTCALDYLSWADYYPEGESKINDITVKRFRISRHRSWEEMGELEKKVNTERKVIFPKKKIKMFFKNLFYNSKYKKATDKDYVNWILAQGPTTPDLINYIKLNEKKYDCLIFFTYLYYPTVFGIEINPAKTIFIPTAHDEWAIRMPIFKKMFTVPACIMYNTMAEKRLVNSIFKNELVYSEIAGVGVDLPFDLPAVDIKTLTNIDSKYILYIGRIDSNKISCQDFEWFLKYIKESEKEIKLVLIGNLYMKIPVNDNIIHLGFVDEHSKFNLIKHSLFLFQPSRFESLSIVVLEAFKLEKPVLVHQDCEVMKNHIESSKGGFYYKDYEGFEFAFSQLTNGKSINDQMGKAGKCYVDKNYSWETVIRKYQNVIENKLPN